MLYAPVRRASVALMCCAKAIITASFDTGAVQAAFENDTPSGSGNVNAPLARWPGSDTLNAAAPAVLITFAVVDAV